MNSKLLLMAALAAPLVAQTAWAQTATTGKVTSVDGQPIANAFVRQEGSLVSTFTDPQGRFSLALSPQGRQVLTINADGYQSRQVSAAQAGNVVLRPVESYVPTFKRQSVEASPPANRPLDLQLGLSYELGRLNAQYGGNTIDGTFDNMLFGHGQVRFGSWLVGGQLDRYKTTVAQSDLAKATVSPERLEYRLRGGYVLGGEHFEIAPSLSVLNVGVTAGTSTLTGTPYDFSHSRRALGVELPFAWELTDRVAVFGSAAYYPNVGFKLDSAPYTISDVGLTEGTLGVGYSVLPALRLDLRYARQMWRGSVMEDQDVLGVGLTYRPERF